MALYQGRPQEGGLRSWHRAGAAAHSRRSGIYLSRNEAEPANLAAGQPYRISDLELASRLSFFLWSSSPDDELIESGHPGQAQRSGSAASSKSGACWRIRVRKRWYATSPASG